MPSCGQRLRLLTRRPEKLPLTSWTDLATPALRFCGFWDTPHRHCLSGSSWEGGGWCTLVSWAQPSVLLPHRELSHCHVTHKPEMQENRSGRSLAYPRAAYIPAAGGRGRTGRQEGAARGPPALHCGRRGKIKRQTKQTEKSNGFIFFLPSLSSRQETICRKSNCARGDAGLGTQGSHQTLHPLPRPLSLSVV